MGSGHMSKERPDTSHFSLLSPTDDESLDEADFRFSAKKRRTCGPAVLRDLIPWCIIIVLATTLLIQTLWQHTPITNPGTSAVKHTNTNANTTPTVPGQSGRCGRTPTEASSLGCVFDYMNFAWQPRDCYFADLDTRHTARLRDSDAGPVRWWADADLTEPIVDNPEVLKWYGEVWVERRYHYRHCMYDWALLHKSYEDGSPLADFMTLNHSLHCAHVLGKAIEVDDGSELLIENVVTWYSDCIWPKHWSS